MPRFSGRDCGVDDFIREAERVSSNYKMEEGAAVEWIIQALSGCAGREVLSRPASEANTLTKVLLIIKDTFGDQRF